MGKKSAWSAGPPSYASLVKQRSGISQPDTHAEPSTYSGALNRPSTTDSVTDNQKRFLFSLLRIVGCKISVVLVNGTVYEGICHTIDPSQLSVSLKLARQVSIDRIMPVIPILNILGSDVAQIDATALEPVFASCIASSSSSNSKKRETCCCFVMFY